MQGTINFQAVKDSSENNTQSLIQQIYNALCEKGYNPVNQIVGYLLSEDPTYITDHNNARSLVSHIDRDELLTLIVKNYIDREISQQGGK